MNTINDSRVFKNVSNVSVDWSKVGVLQGKSYNFKSPAELEEDAKTDPEFGGFIGEVENETILQYGLFGQDLEQEFPSIVRVVDNTETIRTVRYDQLLAILLEHIKDLNSRLEALEGP